MSRVSKVLCPTDGLSAFAPRLARNTGSTADTTHVGDTWFFYDRSRGYIDTVGFEETGVFVADTKSVMHGVVETYRQRYTGVL